MISSLPNHSVLPLTEADLPTHIEFVRTSKLQLTINRLLYKDWPNHIAQGINTTNAVQGAFKDPNTETLKVIEDKSGDMVAHLVLTRKGLAKIEVPDENEGEGTRDGNEAPDYFEPEILSMVVKAGMEIDSEMASIDRLVLVHIYVAPSYRKQGIGSTLLQVALDKARAVGVPLAATVEPQIHEFCLKHGLKDTKHFDMDLAKHAPPYTGFGVFRLYGMVASA